MAEPKVETAEEWSSRHIRLKFQMVISCLVAASYLAYGAKDLRVLGFIELDRQPSDKTLIFLLTSFAIFSIISFVSRTVFEQKSLKPPHKTFDIEIREIEEPVMLFTTSVIDIDLFQLKVSIRELENYVETSKLGESQSNEIEILLRNSIKKIELAESKGSKLHASFNNFEQEELRFFQTELAFTMFKKSFYKVSSNLRRAYDLLLEVKGLVYINPSISALEAKSKVEQVEIIVKAIKEDVLIVFKNLKSFRKKIQKANRYRIIQNWLLSVVTPIISSILFLIFGFVKYFDISFRCL